MLLNKYYLGLDLGQAAEYSALAILEAHGINAERVFHVRHLRRYPLRTSYPDIVADVADVLRREPLRQQSAVLAIDATAVGVAVVDLFRRQPLAAQLRPVIITGGEVVTSVDGMTRIPKRELVSIAQVCLQTTRLKIASELTEAATLTRELQNFKAKITESAEDSYGAWREGSHDDLVLAVALALWLGSQPVPGPGAVAGNRGMVSGFRML